MYIYIERKRDNRCVFDCVWMCVCGCVCVCVRARTHTHIYRSLSGRVRRALSLAKC